MVLQRSQPIGLWGWSAAGREIVARLGSTSTRTQADARGAWSLELPARRAGGPFQLVVRSGSDSIVFSDVLVGDVWVASGQSNMEFEVRSASNATEAIAAANDSSIREFKIPNSWANAPEADLAGGRWLPADRAHVADFSAVAYFFVRHLRPTVDVPIGIINSTWGGSNIETWISRSAQHLTDSAWSALQQGEAAHDRAVRDSLRAKVGLMLPEIDSGLVEGSARWASPSLDDRLWADIRVPAYWESQGYPSLDGTAWYRTTFTLDSSDVAKNITLTAAAIDDDDITWVNGVEVGRTTGYNVPRHYHIPSTVVHPGPNEIAIRVADGGGGGGINGAIWLDVAGSAPRSLAGTWKFRVGRVVLGTDGQRINKIPSVLYNKMVYPILPYAIKGVIWYQGESNANNAQQATAYRGQFATLVESWRRAWNGGREAFPFLWVQLPGYGRPDSVPQLHPAWPLQRESMDAALTLPHTGRAIAIDLGEADDIHPKNKEDVGARLALVGRRVAYGERVDASGPLYRGFVLRGDTAVISFASVGGLRVHGDSLGGFAVAGADRQFVWASARVVGDRVYVWSDRVRVPAAIRYAWANNPDRANLYGANGLPAAPFRSDRW
jgi:sialate O-acetylesterase